MKAKFPFLVLLLLVPAALSPGCVDAPNTVRLYVNNHLTTPMNGTVAFEYAFGEGAGVSQLPITWNASFSMPGTFGTHLYLGEVPLGTLSGTMRVTVSLQNHTTVEQQWGRFGGETIDIWLGRDVQINWGAT